MLQNASLARSLRGRNDYEASTNSNGMGAPRSVPFPEREGDACIGMGVRCFSNGYGEGGLNTVQ